MQSSPTAGVARSVTFHDDRFWVGDEAVPFLSGQIDYWQHIRMYWPRILESTKNCALPIVSLYVPWNFHEIAPGEWDFEGTTEPQRDLAAFLDLAADQGLWIFVRPGPWIYDHWKEGGIPARVAQYHRLHPEFLRQARAYVAAVCQVLRPRLATNGGRIILCQPDNEIDMNGNEPSSNAWIDWQNVGTPYYEQIVTNGAVEDSFSYRHWLKEKYESINRLNRSHGTSFADFASVFPIALGDSGSEAPLAPTGEVKRNANDRLKSPAEYRRLADLLEFTEWYVEEYARTITGYYKEESIDVPMMLNTYPVLEPQNSVRFQEIADLVGTDPWYANLAPWESVLKYSLHARHLRNVTRTALSAEYQSITAGELIDIEHVVTPQNARYLCLLAMDLGLKGWNWFVFAERSVLYFAPINNFGEPVRGYYPSFQQMHRLFQDLDWPSCQKVTSTGLFWYRPHYWFEARWSNPPSTGAFAFSEESHDTAWQRAFEDLHLADVDFELFDPTSAYNKLRRDGLLCYAGGHFMDIAAQECLLEYAKGGGHLLFLASPPVCDLDGTATDVFGFLPRPQAVVTGPGHVVINLDGPDLAIESRSLAIYVPPEGARPITSRFGICGYMMKVGQGKITVLTCEPGPKAWAQLHVILGVPIPSRGNQPHVLTSAWERGDDRLIVTVNCSDAPQQVAVALDLAALRLNPEAQYEVRGALRTEPYCCKGSDLMNIELNIPPKDGEILTISSFTAVSDG